MATVNLSKLGMGAATDTAGALPTLPSTGTVTGAVNASPRGPTVNLSRVQNSKEYATAQANFNPGEFLSGMIQDTVKSAVSPITMVSEATMGFLSDPTVGILPTQDQKEHFAKAGEATIDALSFYGSIAAGGVVGAGIKSAVARAAVQGGVGAGTFQLLNQLPEFMHGDVSPGDYAAGVATASLFGAAVGGTLTGFAPASKYALGKANQIIDANPLTKSVKADISKYTRKMSVHLWDKFFTSGYEVLNKYGLNEVANKLKEVRSLSGFTAGRFVSKFLLNTKDLSEQQKMIMGAVLDTVPFHKPQTAGVRKRIMDRIRADYGEIIGEFSDETFNVAWTRAKSESKRLREIGELLSRANVKVYDATSDTLHRFTLRDSYYPHRLVNADYYRPGGRYYEEAVKKVMDKYELYSDDAAVWVKEFADRIESQNQEFVTGQINALSSSYYLRGRNLNLPGFELGVDNVLPQYYEHAAKRFHTHLAFGPKEPEAAVAAVQQGLFSREEWDNLLPSGARDVPEPYLPGMQEVTGKGMKKTILKEGELTDEQDLINAQLMQSREELAKINSTKRRYPGAYKDLHLLKDEPEKARLAEAIIRRQLGALEKPMWGEETLSRLSNLEVVTKLALGAIAQPSQILSGVFRTEYKSSFKNLLRTFTDPDAEDFALRAAVTLKGIVRTSEQSLTGKDTDFLSKVFFTQMDLKSRVFGALQGASFAEHQVSKLSKLVRKYPALRHPETGRFTTEFRPLKVQKEMQKIERKLMQLGLDPTAIIRRGGYLKENEILQAAQTVSMDVNFWGDSLSLPEFFRSPIGRYVTQFKSFGFQQSKLIKDHLIKPIKDHGDWGPFLRFAILMPAAGEVIADAKGLVRANYRRFQQEGEDGPITRVLENIANAAGFGLVYDALEATKYGNSGSLGFIAGPIGTDTAKTMSALGEFVRGKPKKLARTMIELGLPAATMLPTFKGIPALTPAVAAATPALSNLLLPKREAP